MSASERLHCRSSVSVLLHQLWFGSMQGKGERGRGVTGISHCSSACCTHPTVHSIHIYALYSYMIILGPRDAEKHFFLKQLVRNSYPTCCNRETVSYPQDVCKLCERACKANTWRQSKLSDRFFQTLGTRAHMLCWWLFLHHHAHTYPSVKGNELSPCKISSQSLFTHGDEKKHCVKATRMIRYIHNLQ